MTENTTARATTRVKKAAPKAKATKSTTKAAASADKATTVEVSSRWTVPTVKLPDVSFPEVKLPDMKLPEVKLPEVRFPEVKKLETELTAWAGRTKQQVVATTIIVRNGVAHTVTLVREAVGV